MPSEFPTETIQMSTEADAGLQAIEKYLKAILLFSGCGIRRYSNGHDLPTLLEAVKQIPLLCFQLPSESERFVERLSATGANRYLDVPFSVRSEDLEVLDWTAWHTRVYCQDFYLKPGDETAEVRAALSSAKLEAARAADPSRAGEFLIKDGFLERVLSAGPEETRRALIEGNPCYGGAPEPARQQTAFFFAQNPLPFLQPNLVEFLEGYVKISPRVRHQLRQSAQPPTP